MRSPAAVNREAATAVRAARSLLFERGWVQCVLIDAHGALCLEGAVQHALPEDSSAGVRIATRNFIRQAITPDSEMESYVGWNDSPGRTFDEVVEVLDRAEKLAEIAIG